MMAVAHVQDNALAALRGLLPDDALTSIPDDTAGLTQWLEGVCRSLTTGQHERSVALGLLLEACHTQRIWQQVDSSGETTWRQWLAGIGLDEGVASKLRTVGRELVLILGMPAENVAAIGDSSKAYMLASRFKRAMAQADGDEQAQAAIRRAFGGYVADAALLSRSDLRLLLDDDRVPSETDDITLPVKMSRAEHSQLVDAARGVGMDAPGMVRQWVNERLAEEASG